MATEVWLDLSCGASGDMLLGALHGAGVPLEEMGRAVAALGLPLQLTTRQVRKAGFAATKVDVMVGETGADPPARPWPTVRRLLTDAPLPDGVRELALQVFSRLAAAEATVHASEVETVHFHEVGALDALADVVGCCAGFVHLAASRVTASPVALGGGQVRTSHGVLPVPAPAVLELLRTAGAPTHGGPVDVELCTPTGAAIVTTVATSYGPLPPLSPHAIGVGAGDRDLPDRPNVLRLVVGSTAGVGEGAADLLLETNVDDLDLRVWPGVLHALLDAGASDAWLTPILMKKGRPAHTLSVLVTAAAREAVQAVIYRETTTLGVRVQQVGKDALARAWVTVEVAGQPVRIKIGSRAGRTVNAMPEWEDVARAAAVTGLPAKQVLSAAMGQAAALADPPAGDDDSR